MKKNENLYLKYLLWEAKIKQKEIASQAGCSQQLVSQYLSGHNNSRIVKSTIKKLLESSPDFAEVCFQDEIKNITSSSSSSSSSIKDKKKKEDIKDFENTQENIRENVTDELLLNTWKSININVQSAGYIASGRKQKDLDILRIILLKHDWTIIVKVLEYAFDDSWWKTKIRDTSFILNNYVEIWKQWKMSSAGIIQESYIKNICDVRD